MIPFHKPQLEDRAWAQPLLSRFGGDGSEAAFGTYYVWQQVYGFEIAHHKGFFLARCNIGYFFPMGEGDLQEILTDLEEDARQREEPFRFVFSEPCDQKLEQLCPERFEIVENRSSADYIYRVEDLIRLGGKKYHAKRNHISRFVRNYEYCYEPVETDLQVRECIEMARRWGETAANPEDAAGELEAIRAALEHRQELGMVAGLLRVDGQAIAFAAGEPINDTVFLQHFEKALVAYDGAYAVINHDFMTHCICDYVFVNREEDMGLEGLRKAKLSYLPERLLRKYAAIARTI
ncbi:MAG: DUF2156 domain-containing protein [Clostridia bacterium]|nr:DUF2156 domain-containing protein [Clostridia bacterium]